MKERCIKWGLAAALSVAAAVVCVVVPPPLDPLQVTRSVAGPLCWDPNLIWGSRPEFLKEHRDSIVQDYEQALKHNAACAADVSPMELRMNIDALVRQAFGQEI